MNFQIITEKEFNALYPIKMQKLSNTHWTPLEVVKKAISFLIEGRRNSILDLGSGSGKFCIVAAACTDAEIVGVEKRENLVQISRKISASLSLENLNFIHGDLIDQDFNVYESFYFFNAFEELVNSKDKLDKSQELDLEGYQEYIKLIRDKFEQLPLATRIVTYCGECEEIPDSYRLLKSENKGKLKFWEKQE